MQSWIVYSQHGTVDSLKLYSAPIWKVRRLVHDASLKAHCDSVNRALEAELTITKHSLSNQIMLTNEVTISRDTWKYTSLAKDTLIQNNKVIHKLDLKNEKAKGNKKGLIGIGIGFFIGLLLL